MLTDCSQLSLHLSYLVIACILAFLLLQRMLLQIIAPLLYFTIQGMASYLFSNYYYTRKNYPRNIYDSPLQTLVNLTGQAPLNLLYHWPSIINRCTLKFPLEWDLEWCLRLRSQGCADTWVQSLGSVIWILCDGKIHSGAIFRCHNHLYVFMQK